jgi:energy-coupling factor transporter ATP-binding protein EcfA2
MFKTTKNFKSERLSLLVYGPSGSGKTTVAATLPGKILFVNAENGLLSISSGKELAVYDLTVDGSGKDLPRDFRFEKLLHLLKEVLPGMTDKFDWLVFDSMTEISQNLVEGLKKKYPDKADGLKLWGEYNDFMVAFIKQLRDYRPFNILLLALDSVDKDDTGKRFVGVDINGKISSRVPALIDEVFYLKDFDTGEGKKVKKLITSTYQNIIAKDRSGKLDQFEDPNLSAIINKINGVKA